MVMTVQAGTDCVTLHVAMLACLTVTEESDPTQKNPAFVRNLDSSRSCPGECVFCERSTRERIENGTYATTTGPQLTL